MSFISLQYLAFLGILFLVYYLAGRRYKSRQWLVLLVASYAFYGFYSLKYSLFLIFSTLVTWGAAIGIDSCGAAEKREIRQNAEISREEKARIRAVYKKKKTRWIVLAVVLNIGLLFVMKYANFAIDSLNALFGLGVPRLGWVVLPLGFSFYTFQSLGYCIDVYRGSVDAQHNLLRYALFVSFFPQICEGPIGNYGELYGQLAAGHDFEYDSFIKGLIRILIGFFKKVVVADTLAAVVDPIYANYSECSGLVLCLATALYAIQLYADFSGYIDIALGTGACLGIRMTENFSTPYFSRSIPEYWRRWHISLGVWFRNYLYYPVLRSRAVSRLGKRLQKNGKRKLASAVTATIGLAVTWISTGLWHGAAFKYVAWGCYHGFFIILAVWLGDACKKARDALHIKENAAWKLFQTVRTFVIVLIGYVLFRADGFRDAVYIYIRVLTAFTGESALSGLPLLSQGEWIVVFFGVACVFLLDLIERKRPAAEWVYGQNTVPRWLILYVILAITLLFFSVRPSDAGNFIYFDF